MIPNSNIDSRLRCPSCLAVFRTGFDCCPADGAALVVASGPDPLIGATIADRYVIEDLVGEGSMGMIYRARHERLPVQFAIKVLFGDLVADPRMRIRFAQEAALASRLSHPNVVSVVDFGRSDAGLLYLVMSYVEGEPLSELIAREAPLDTAQAIRLTRQLAQGLAHAHQQGLVHRDFKPGNVVLERSESGTPVPRILDFGLAISMHDREDGGEGAGRLTECGLIVGTPIYIAPEQALDRPVDHRADLFALGVTLFEMLTGRPPFDGKPVEIAHKNVTHPLPSMAQRRPGLEVPAALERVVRKLCAKNPDSRYASAEELCEALDEVEWGVARAETQGMRAAIYDPDAPGLDAPTSGFLESDELTWMVRRRGRAGRWIGAAIGAAAAALVVGTWQGWIDVGPFDAEVPVASAASEAPVQASASDSAAASASAPVVRGLASQPQVEALGGPGAPRERGGQATPQARAASQPARRPAALRGERTREEPRPWNEARMRPTEDDDEPAGDDMDAAAMDPALLAAAPTEPADATPEHAPTPLSVDSSASVDRLIRDYRDVGQAIAHLQARGGDKVAGRLRDRYFRLPYGDALRIPAVRRDALSELAGLRHEVEDAIQSLPAPATPNG